MAQNITIIAKLLAKTQKGQVEGGCIALKIGLIAGMVANITCG